jgi:hypothetical protein
MENGFLKKVWEIERNQRFEMKRLVLVLLGTIGSGIH